MALKKLLCLLALSAFLYTMCAEGKGFPLTAATLWKAKNKAGFNAMTMDISPSLIENPLLDWQSSFGISESFTDNANGVVRDAAGNVYITGKSDGTWGAPLNPHAGQYDAFVVKLDSEGNQLWNTFSEEAGMMPATAYAWMSRGTST